jgi:cell division protein FtsI (penicillin-binding protein 3)
VRSPDLGRLPLRIRLVCAVMLAGFALLAIRAGHLTVVETRGADRGFEQWEAEIHIPPARGFVVDREEAELAVSVTAPSVYVRPRALADRRDAARQLARVLGVSAAVLEKRFDPRHPWVHAARWVTRAQARAVEALELRGVGVFHEPRRIHPHRELAAHVLGFANIDGVGVRGIEQQEDAWLRGRPVEAPVERDARRRALALGDLDPITSAGGDVRLTLDAALQAEVEASLQAGVERAQGQGGIAILLDPRSGEILALAERPGFDPNDFRRVPYETTRSRALLDAVEPGSTLKTFVVAAALEHGVLDPHQVIDCEEGTWRVPGRTLRDLHPQGLLDPAGVLRESSNIGAAKIGFLLGPERHHEMLRRFGFGVPTGVGFPEESSGLLRSWQRWRPLDHATISFGQGVSVTPLQLASAMGAIANDGLWLQPRLVAARRRPREAWQIVATGEPRRVLRPEVARMVRQMLEQVVGPEGTGRRAGLAGVRVAGKTGTAQKLDPATGRYSANSYLSWFVGVAPAEEPLLVGLVVIDEPRGKVRTGGALAAPVFAEIATAHLARRGIVTHPEPIAPPPAPVRVADAPASPAPEAAATAPAAKSPGPAPSGDRGAQRADGGRNAPRTRTERNAAGPEERLLLPDLRGMSRAEARALLAASAVGLVASCDGRVVGQEPDPGTILGSGAAVRVWCESGGRSGDAPL